MQTSAASLTLATTVGTGATGLGTYNLSGAAHLNIAGDICIYTNRNIVVEEL